MSFSPRWFVTSSIDELQAITRVHTGTRRLSILVPNAAVQRNVRASLHSIAPIGDVCVSTQSQALAQIGLLVDPSLELANESLLRLQVVNAIAHLSNNGPADICALLQTEGARDLVQRCVVISLAAPGNVAASGSPTDILLRATLLVRSKVLAQSFQLPALHFVAELLQRPSFARKAAEFFGDIVLHSPTDQLSPAMELLLRVIQSEFTQGATPTQSATDKLDLSARAVSLSGYIFADDALTDAIHWLLAQQSNPERPFRLTSPPRVALVIVGDSAAAARAVDLLSQVDIPSAGNSTRQLERNCIVRWLRSVTDAGAAKLIRSATFDLLSLLPSKFSPRLLASTQVKFEEAGIVAGSNDWSFALNNIVKPDRYRPSPKRQHELNEFANCLSVIVKLLSQTSDRKLSSWIAWLGEVRHAIIDENQLDAADKELLNVAVDQLRSLQPAESSEEQAISRSHFACLVAQIVTSLQLDTDSYGIDIISVRDAQLTSYDAVAVIGADRLVEAGALAFAHRLPSWLADAVPHALAPAEIRQAEAIEVIRLLCCTTPTAFFVHNDANEPHADLTDIGLRLQSSLQVSISPKAPWRFSAQNSLASGSQIKTAIERSHNAAAITAFAAQHVSHELCDSRGLARLTESLDVAIVGSATKFESLLQCPQMFFLGKLLHLQDIDDPDERWSVEKRFRGTIVHKVLETFFREHADVDPDYAWEQSDFARVDEICGDVLGQACADRKPATLGIWIAEQRAIRHEVKATLEADSLYRAATRARPFSFEWRFGAPRQSCDEEACEAPSGNAIADFTLSSGRLVKFRGAIDRIDRVGEAKDGDAIVIDYKTGDSKHFNDVSENLFGREGKRIQLAIYAYAVRQFFQTSSVRTAYWFTAKFASNDRANAILQAPEIADQDRVLAERVNVLGTMIEDGIYPHRAGTWCRTCDVATICTRDRDQRSVVQLADPRVRNYVELLQDVGVTNTGVTNTGMTNIDVTETVAHGVAEIVT